MDITPEQFGTIDYPLRASALPALLRCAGALVLEYGISSEGGPAAHTGTAVGRAIELWHRGEGDPIPQVKEESTSARHPFHLANWSEVEQMLSFYVADPRNDRRGVLTTSLEERVEYSIDPHDTDPTREQIWIRGHLDQVRVRQDGTREIWDLKSGQAQGHEMVNSHLMQQVAYTYGYARAHPEHPVMWGGIIRLRGYMTRQRTENPDYDAAKGKKNNPKTKLVARDPGTEPVFFNAGLRWADVEHAVEIVRLCVARVRSRSIVLRPGSHCDWCPGERFTMCRRTLKSRGFDV
tara:strand:+ start:111 stop:989 length:879 start_codon:yes stop_codon:yes gene_type:complete